MCPVEDFSVSTIMAHFNQASHDPCTLGRVSVKDGTEDVNGYYLL